MAQRLILVRHARTAAAHAGRLIGATDVPLCAVGRQQAAALAERIGRWSPERCCSSPMLRCRETAAAMLPGVEVRFDDDLREIDMGECEGRTFAEVARQWPAVVEHWAALSADFAFPGGEGLSNFVERVQRAADRLAGDDAATVLAVTHGGVIRAMLCHFLGLEPRQYVLFDVGFASTVTIDLFDGPERCRGVLSALEPMERGDVQSLAQALVPADCEPACAHPLTENAHG